MKLQLYRPVKARQADSLNKNQYNPQFTGISVVSQFFGESWNPLYKQLGMLGHNGIDIPIKSAEPIYASHDGIVNMVSTDLRLGYGVELLTNEAYDYKDQQAFYKTRYWHLLAPVVSPGQKVELGQILGYGDNTGMSTGDHLHWDLKPIFKKDGVWQNYEPINGYFGCINLLPYLIEQDAFQERKDLDSVGAGIIKAKFILDKISEIIKNLFKKVG